MSQPISMPWSAAVFGELPHAWKGVRMAVFPFTPRALELDENPDRPRRQEPIREGARAGVIGSNLPESLGGLGHDPFMSALVIEELLRGAKLTQIYEGTNQINRFEIAEEIPKERRA